MSNKIKLTCLSIFIFSFLFSVTLPVLAASWPINFEGGGLIPTNCTGSQKDIPLNGSGGCGVTQMFQTIVNVSQLILALTGSAALLMFVYGGVLWIISAGSAEQVQKGKSAMTAAAIGIVIILTAWTAVNVTILAITKGEVGSTASIFGQNWFDEHK